MTDVYTAIMRAADHIERNPECNDFGSPEVVPGRDLLGLRGCALAWIGHFLERQGRYATWAREVAGECLGCHEDEAIKRLSDLEPKWKLCGPFGTQAEAAPFVAKALRLYAAKYHAPAKPDTGFRDFMAKALPVSDHVREWRETAIDIIKTPRDP